MIRMPTMVIKIRVGSFLAATAASGAAIIPPELRSSRKSSRRSGGK